MADAELLRGAGLRVTDPRLTVLQIVRSRPHLTADDVLSEARARSAGLSVQGTYDVLDALVRADLLRRIEPAGSPARFETRVADNHHHVVCRVCGATADVDCAVGRMPCLTPSDAGGFVVDEAEVTWWGLCPACQNDTHTGGGGGGAAHQRRQAPFTRTSHCASPRHT